MLRNKFRRLNTRGDTIIEVLIVLAVLGLAFAISSATANRGLVQSRNAEEHSQALGVLNSQVELLRTAIAKGVDVSTQSGVYCLNGPASVKGFTSYSNFDTPTNDSTNNYNKYPTECKSGQYSIGVKNNTGYLDVRVRWDGGGSLGPQQENYVYRVDKTASGSSNIAVTSTASQITVEVKAIAPDGDQKPSCSKTTYNSKPNVLVTLNQVGSTGPGATKPTGTGNPSVATFAVPVEFASYTASITGGLGSYEVCGLSTSLPLLVTPGSGNNVVTFYIRPTCPPGTPTAPYAHYSTPYAHYSAPYYHYSAPYDHYSGPYASYSCYNTYDKKGNYTGTTCGVSGYYYQYNGTYGDYLGYYGDYQGTYGDYQGTYADPVPNKCSP